jgi:hypothetical protein
VQVKNKRERSSPVRPPGVKTSRLGSRDRVANGFKCKPHGGKNSGMKSWTVSWLSLKTKVLTVNSCIKVHLDLQADKSPFVVKGPFFP